MQKIKAFTLTEILIVVLIISVTFILIPKIKIQSQTSTITNLQSRLLKYDFDDSLELVCVDECKNCLVKSDGKVVDKIDIFKTKPQVYNIDIDEISFDDIEDDFEIKEVCFRWQFDKYKKFDEFILGYKDNYYYFSNAQPSPLRFDTLSAVDEYFTNLNKEVKDAF